VLFGASYWVLRCILAALVYRSVYRGGRVVPSPYLVSAVLSGPLLLAGGLVDGPARVIRWACAAVIDLGTPAVLRRRLAHVRFDPSHLPERYGLFVLIAIGESIVAIGAPAAAAGHLDTAVVLAVAAAFVLACGLWWVYFHFASAAVRHAMATASVQIDILRRVLSYGHLAFISGIIAVSVGIAEVVAHPLARLDGGVAGLLFGGCALYLATFGYTRWQMFRLWSMTRLTAAAVVLALLPFVHLLEGLAALGMLAVLVVGLNAWEYARVRRAGSL
jgi:low temperature requirement protein LtrA